MTPPPIEWPSDGRSRKNNQNNASEQGAQREPNAQNGQGSADDSDDSRSMLFAAEEPRRRLSDLVVSAVTEKQLRTALAKIKYHRRLYQDWGLETIHPEGRGMGINLYGPPGTGKSFAAEGIAEHLGRPIIRIDYAQIESRFVGDTPKNIVSAFAAAHEQNAVLFFDEADSVLSRRVTNITQAADYGVNVTRSTLLLQLDQFEGVVLFATNLASNYDPAFVRRILAHVYFPLPDIDALTRLWRYHLPAQLPIAPEVTPEALSALSDGLSGGDVLNCVILAASAAVESGRNRVLLSDFEESIGQIRRSKKDIAVSPFGFSLSEVDPPHISEQ